MELECEKYRQKIKSKLIACNHPDDYCQFRTSCIIHFMETEARREIKDHLSGKIGSDKKNKSPDTPACPGTH